MNRFCFLLFAISFIHACNQIIRNKEHTATELVEKKVIHDIDRLLNDLPDPSLVPFTLKSIFADFNQELINDLGNAKNYKGDRNKMALNMGIYASDVNYLAAYDREERCLDYLRVSHELARELGDSTIYSEAQLDAFKGHIKGQNEGEIAKLLKELFLKTSLQMERTHHLEIAGLALTGSFIEGLYHAIITIDTYPVDSEHEQLLEPLINIVLGEERALKDVITILKDLPPNDTITDVIIELSILDRLYKGDLQDIEEKMKNDPDFILTKDVMKDITLEVKRIRSSIVE